LIHPGLGAAAILSAAELLVACGSSDRPKVPQNGPTVKTEFGIARPYGRGTSAVWVLTPKHGKVRSVVVYIHGWTATSPFLWHQAWFDHLLHDGSAVVFPVYQLTGDFDELVTSPYELRNGLRTGFRALGKPDLPVVVAGYSVGGALAFYYGADAGEWNLPRPRAVYSIFPFDPILIDPGLANLATPPAVRTLVLVGDKDTTVGRVGADTFWKWLAPLPRSLKTYRMLHSNPKGLWFDHESLPTSEFDSRMQSVFWGPLDALVSEARSAD
jgi:pimeloyl-ACP methyl ester carboxylesterase